MAASSVLDELSAHLDEVEANPATALDEHLLERCELFASTSDYLDSGWKGTESLFSRLANLLPALQQDPTPLSRFIMKLTRPYRFDNVKNLDFESGLHLAAQPYHGLVLSLIEKATASSTDAQALANRPTLMLALVRLWLCVQDTAIASQASNLLISLLRVSVDEPSSSEPGSPRYGTGPIWKRLFQDRDIYTLFYYHTSFEEITLPDEPRLSRRDRTIAQARLLEFLPEVGKLDWITVMASHHRDIEKRAGLGEGQGLLHYASLKMVDIKDDILMHLTLIRFFTDLITTVTTQSNVAHRDPKSSLSLDFLRDNGLHKEIIDFHTSDSPGLEYSFVTTGSAHYIAQYVSLYPDHFENSQDLETIRRYIKRNIHKCEPGDLSILAAMPRSTLIPRLANGFSWDNCLVLGVPIAKSNADAIKTLATIFHGPPKEEVTFPMQETGADASNRSLAEGSYARLLAALYYVRNPDMFSDIARHAKTPAMKDTALAALTFMSAIITSNWGSSSLLDQVSENDHMYHRLQTFPKTGIDLVCDVGTSSPWLTYLTRPPDALPGVIAGEDNAAYQVAMAKFDVVKLLNQRLHNVDAPDSIKAVVREGVAQGPWGRTNAAGSRVGTLDL